MAARRGCRFPRPTSSPTSTAAAPGQSDIVTPRKEADECQILSGVFQGRTLGTPSPSWCAIRTPVPRPTPRCRRCTARRMRISPISQVRHPQLGGRRALLRACEAIGRVAAGAVAKKILRTLHPGSRSFPTSRPFTTQRRHRSAGRDLRGHRGKFRSLPDAATAAA